VWASAGFCGAPVELVRASFLGTAADDDLQGGCAAPDGTILVAGNTGVSMAAAPGGVDASRLGAASANPRCGHGFVARLSADGGKVLAYAEFGKGILALTTVKANSNGVYVAGYATEALEPLLRNAPGLVREYPLRREVALLEAGKWPEAVGEEKDNIPESQHGQLGRYGAPCVLRLSADLSRVECGTYLEGWQQVWGKSRCISTKPAWKCWPPEYSWQPTLVGALKSGDLIVCHDGGYYRLLTPEDRALVAKTAPRTAHRLGFYDVCDHLSRLSSDLARRAYRQPIYTPATDVETAKRLKDGWPYPHFSNPRTHRMRLGDDESVYFCGWSASATSQESWWSPYVWRMRSDDGGLIRKIQETDPMSGPGNRMGGAVADRGIGAIAVESDGAVVSSSYSDGGWSGLIHFSGSIWRTGAASGGEGQRIARTGPCFWVTDMASLPGNRLLTVGRCNYTGTWPEDAWQKADAEENPVAWLRLYGGVVQDDARFTTAIRGVIPYELCELGGGRFMVVGRSPGKLQTVTGRGTREVAVTEAPNPGVAVVKGPLFEKQQGQGDGYFMILKASAPAGGD
jgi:hypothetical protein